MGSSSLFRRGLRFLILLACLFVALPFAVLPCHADEDLRLPRVVISSGGPYVCRGATIQQFYSSIDVPADYFRQPLSMVCTNGSETEPGYSWVRVFMLPDKRDQDLQTLSQPVGRLLVDEKSFLASAQIYLDLSSQLKPGGNKIFIEGAGRPGAVFSWELRSIGKPQLFMPQVSSTVSGGWLTIYGTGFSLRANENTVQLGPAYLPVGQSNASSLQVYIPKECPAGTYDLSVSIRSYRSRSVKLQVVSPKS